MIVSADWFRLSKEKETGRICWRFVSGSSPNFLC